MKSAPPIQKLEIGNWKFIEWGLLAIVAIMPLHAFKSIYLGHIIGHQSLVQGWKEAVIAILVCLTAVQVIKRPTARMQLYSPLGVIIWAFIALSLVVTAFTLSDAGATLFGIKTDLEFLVLFLIAQIAATRPLLGRAANWFLASSTLVAIIALIQPLLPLSFIQSLGYSAATIDPRQYVEGTGYLRVFSTLGGPNQLGSFLILPLCLLLARMIRRFRWWQPLAFGLMLAALGLTYSRSAWLGAAAALAVTLVLSLPPKRRLAGALSAVVAAGILGAITYASLGSTTAFTSLVRHGASNAQRTSDHDHAIAIDHAIDVTEHHPLGLGLGSAGPASFQSDQPLITENYYLQIAVETGIAGLILFCGVIAILGLLLLLSPTPVAKPLLGGLIGISIVNLFLHGWADSSTALTYWTLAGLTIGLIKEKPAHDTLTN